MKVNEILMRRYRENPQGVREIFETVRNTDTDRAEAREYIKYLGKDTERITDREKNFSLAGVGLVVAGAGLLMVDANYSGGTLIFSGLVTSLTVSFYLIEHTENGVGGREKNYKSVRKDAIRNLETKAQNPS